MSVHPIEQVIDAYKAMADFYRPAAPSDGFGTITAPLDTLDLDDEAERYAVAFWDEENGQRYDLGCPTYEDRPALVYLVEAARLLCGQEPQAAARLARMAADLLDRPAQ